jgi:hypothetical protein
MKLAFASCTLLLALACSPAPPAEEPLREIPLDSLDELITKSGVELDHGAIKVVASGPVTVRVAELEGVEIENARLIYRARLKSEGLNGRAYLEMWCAFPGAGEFFSRALDQPLTGTSDWTTQETPFLLQKGQKPSRVKLNLVVEGEGTVWIDQIVLAKAAL